ncbi:hypothetical protein [Nocardia mexicana]|uniref:Uncharacterized protein n=1 Tax=Nocardia mexicana TaxID=279262 RepID=A0A370HD07_9NOCA|nr:hypothetical protein [Nocardia mexicana]RDI54597.1 hypothetical protein DFR68_102726 [Nocardia mexicana]
MSTAMWSTLLGLVVILGGAVYLLLSFDDEDVWEPGEDSTRVVEVVGWHHGPPPEPFTVKAAHQVMRQHKTCRRQDCARKRAAWERLVEVRHVTPDSGRTQ